MVKVRVSCAVCAGLGNIPANEAKKNIYGEIRTFPHICTNCGGEGSLLMEVDLELLEHISSTQNLSSTQWKIWDGCITKDDYLIHDEADFSAF